MNRIDNCFRRLAGERRAGFIAYITAGDPAPAFTVPIVLEMERCGADLVEMGVPFSDPLADGVVNQRSAERALRNRVSVSTVLGLVRGVRAVSQIPIVLFTYLNPVFSYGFVRFARDAARAGADGVLSLDLPPEEAGRYEAELRGRGLKAVFLVAPTTPRKRMALIAKHASGFIYYVSRTGVTGERPSLEADIARRVKSLRRITRTPVAVGFGISTPSQVKALSRAADAVVVGSAIVREIERGEGRADLIARVGEMVRRLSAPLRVRRTLFPHGKEQDSV